MNDSPETMSLDHLRRILRRRRWLVVPFVVAAGAAGVLLALASPREHTATATVLIDSATVGGSSLGASGRVTAGVAARVLRTRGVAARVRRELSEERSVSELLASVSAQPNDNDAFLDITARDDVSATRAAKLANTFAEQFIAARKETVGERAREAIATAQRELSALPPASRERSSLGSELAQLRATAALGGFDAELIDPAVPGSAQTGGSPVRWGAAGAALGLLFGLVLAFSAEALDPRVRRSDELRRMLDAPQLAALPSPKPRSRRRRTPLVLSEAREPFDHLRATLLVLSGEARMRRVIVTSPSDRREGIATVAANLAVSFARLGLRVCVVDTDLRQPALASHFGLDDAAPGFADAIGGASISHAVRRFTLPAVAAVNGSRPAEAVQLSVVSAGSGGADGAAELLAGARVEQVLSELGSDHDVVIVQCAPILAASEVLPLLRSASGTILVVRHSHTTRRDVARAERVIGDAGGSMLGLVVTGVPKGELAADGYGPWPSRASPSGPAS